MIQITSVLYIRLSPMYEVRVIEERVLSFGVQDTDVLFYPHTLKCLLTSVEPVPPDRYAVMGERGKDNKKIKK